MDTLKKVKPGDKLRIPANAYNAFVDAALAHQGKQHNISRPVVSSAKNDTIKVKNISGADVSRFGILGIGGAVFDPATDLQVFQNEIVLTGVAPAGTDHSDGRFVICCTPIANGCIGTAWISGICAVQIDVLNESDTKADIAEGITANLVSGSGGPCTILWKEAGTGLKWAVVRWGAAGGGGDDPYEITVASVYDDESERVYGLSVTDSSVGTLIPTSSYDPDSGNWNLADWSVVSDSTLFPLVWAPSGVDWRNYHTETGYLGGLRKIARISGQDYVLNKPIGMVGYPGFISTWKIVGIETDMVWVYNTFEHPLYVGKISTVNTYGYYTCKLQYIDHSLWESSSNPLINMHSTWSYSAILNITEAGAASNALAVGDLLIVRALLTDEGKYRLIGFPPQYAWWHG